MRCSETAHSADTDFSEWGVDFLCTNEMSVAMYMPGCLDVFVNNSHFSKFGQGFRRVSSSTECHELLDAFLDRRNEQFEEGRCYPARRCYCDKASALFAASDDFCAFERAFKALSHTKDSCVTEMCFLKSGNDSTRVYDVIRIHMRRIPNGYAGSFVEARLIPLGGIQIEMRTTETNEDGITARAIGWRVSQNGADWLKPRESRVPFHKAYQEFGALLVTARRRLEKGEGLEDVRESILERIGLCKEICVNGFCFVFLW